MFTGARSAAGALFLSIWIGLGTIPAWSQTAPSVPWTTSWRQNLASEPLWVNGNPLPPDTSLPEKAEIFTGPFGQCHLQRAREGEEIRLKERTRLDLSPARGVTLSNGMVGLRFEGRRGRPAQRITTPHLTVDFRTGILAIKVHPLMSRVAVLKGTAVVTGASGTTRLLGPRQETAGAAGEISEIYPASDELYFAWYWDPQKP